MSSSGGQPAAAAPRRTPEFRSFRLADRLVSAALHATRSAHNRPMGHQGPGRKTTAAWGACAAVSRPLSGPAAAAARKSQLTAMNSWAPARLPRRHRFARCATSNGAATRAALPSYAPFGPACGAGGRGAASFWPAARQNPAKIPRSECGRGPLLPNSSEQYMLSSTARLE